MKGAIWAQEGKRSDCGLIAPATAIDSQGFFRYSHVPRKHREASILEDKLTALATNLDFEKEKPTVVMDTRISDG